jgi:hypothetical protein
MDLLEQAQALAKERQDADRLAKQERERAFAEREQKDREYRDNLLARDFDAKIQQWILNAAEDGYTALSLAEHFAPISSYIKQWCKTKGFVFDMQFRSRHTTERGIEEWTVLTIKW